MYEGDAILGIFLATYSSKGDYLPLRYPLSQFDYEYAESVLKATADAETRKRKARMERAGTGGNTGRNDGGNAGKDSSVINVANDSAVQTEKVGTTVSTDGHAPDLAS
ncbi:hypothetical protein GGI22_005051, partial [Coemansia erecta]